MARHDEVRGQLLRELDDLRREATTTYEDQVLAHPEVSFHQSLYGFVSRAFSFVDLLSAYWRGQEAPPQTARMASFLERYGRPGLRHHRLAIRIWRHKLFHTSRPRRVIEPGTSTVVTYLIQWHEDRMTEHQPHYAIVARSANEEVFGIACLSLIADVQAAATAFFEDVASSPELQANVARFDASLESG